MAKFREFYIPAGAGSNFIAGKCLWTNKADSKQYVEHKDLGPNEYYFDREQINKKWSFLSDIDDGYPVGIYRQLFWDENEDAILKIKKVLKELSKVILSFEQENNPESTFFPKFSNQIQSNIHTIFENDCSYHCDLFISFDYLELPLRIVADNLALLDDNGSFEEKVRQVSDYFAKCREYYWNICEKNDYDAFMISHKRPLESISPRLKLPENFKSLAMELDGFTTMFANALQDIKSDNYDPNGYTNNVGHQSDENFRCVENSDDTVSYRKIFFENNVEEIRKMYDFFDNADYFEENKTNIMKEFKEYHDNNMIVIKDYMPLFYERVKKF